MAPANPPAGDAVVPAVEVRATLGECTAVRVIVETDFLLDEPTVDFGFVSWFEIRLVKHVAADDSELRTGTARAARIHVGEVINAGETLYDVLDADSGELERLHAVFLDEGGFRDEFRQGAGNDLLYLSHVTLEPRWQDRNVELAFMRRLCDTLGQGCEIAVVPSESDAEAARWERMGFQRLASDPACGLLYLPLAMQQARVVATAESTFKVVPHPTRGDRHH